MAPRPPNPHHPLVRARERVGLQQKVAASQLGISPNTLGRYERGERKPDAALLDRMAATYRVPVDDLLTPASVPRETRGAARPTQPAAFYDGVLYAAQAMAETQARLIAEARAGLAARFTPAEARAELDEAEPLLEAAERQLAAKEARPSRGRRRA